MTLPKLGEPALGTNAGAAKPKSRRLVKSVERALGLLELLAASDGKLRLNTIAGRMGLNVSTCHHLLSTLVEHGYVGHAQDRTYFLGNKILELSGSRIGQFSLVEAAMESLRALNEKTGEKRPSYTASDRNSSSKGSSSPRYLSGTVSRASVMTTR